MTQTLRAPILTNNRRDLPGGHLMHDFSSYARGTLLYVPIGHAVKPPSHVAAAIVSLAQYPPTLHSLHRGFPSEGWKVPVSQISHYIALFVAGEGFKDAHFACSGFGVHCV